MKITLSRTFAEWFQKTNPHLFTDLNDKGMVKNQKNLTKEVTDYVNDVLAEHMEQLESELHYDDDSPDSGFINDDNSPL